jgi:phospholipid N-methyltransferase
MPAVSRFRRLLGALVHKNPSMRILEVGAGTGAMTRQLMKTLTASQLDDKESVPPHYQQYDYTDVSPFFFVAAQETYSHQRDRVQFKKLDIEIDPEDQGFECGSYDIVVAAAVCFHGITTSGSIINIPSGFACHNQSRQISATLPKTSEAVSACILVL